MYKLTKGGVEKTNLDASKTFIPVDHRLWSEYQTWLSQGNTATPADPKPVKSRKDKRRLDSEFPDVQTFMEAVMDSNPAALNGLKTKFSAIKARNL